uniref:GAB2 n=1 Tax=Haemonchus placei TaxID=6290 RepID=A0A0N4WDT0_HAEPC
LFQNSRKSAAEFHLIQDNKFILKGRLKPPAVTRCSPPTS